MRALVMTAFGKVELLDRPEPRAAEHEVILEVAACGICGSDVHGYRGEEPRRQPGLVMGHECVGHVALSSRPELPAGQRVAVNPLTVCGRCRACIAGRSNHCTGKFLLGLDDVPGAFAERAAIAAGNVFPLASDVPDETACLIEPLACAVHLLSLSPAPPCASTALFGCGALGALVLLVAKRLGYGPISVIEPSAGRRRIALALGAEEALDPAAHDVAAALTRSGEGVEISLDATGASAARRAACAATRPGGAVMLLGTDDRETELPFRDIVRKELRLQTSYGFTPDDFARAKGLVEAGAVDLRPWTADFPLQQGQQAFEALRRRSDDLLKVVLRPGG